MSSRDHSIHARRQAALPFFPFLCGLLILFAMQAVPLSAGTTKREAFAWNQDELWKGLEQRFVEARSRSCADLEPAIHDALASWEAVIGEVENRTLDADDPLWDTAEFQMLTTAPLLAACPSKVEPYTDMVHRLQRAVKLQAAAWPSGSAAVRQRLYRLIYGGRSAIEEITLQVDDRGQSDITRQMPSQSAAPAVTVHGVTLHSGDILVSRGGAATSALIARGNDFPGNFSHVALLYVDARTGHPAVLEALIETGAVVSSLEHYLADKKLRIMVLRLRSDLPQLRLNPVLAHQAAQWAFDSIRQKHIAYDFEMDYLDHRKLFCAELIYAAFEQQGIHLWTELSHISSPGTARWLAAFGVSHFTTLEPSDLEYDPQLSVVAEWRDSRTLFKDHVDNAVTDALLEGANAGAPLAYNHWLLPLAGALKVYSTLKNRLGSTGPIPEGMPSAAALRNRWYTRKHDRMTTNVLKLADSFKKEKGYTPPYWELVRMAREVR